MGNLCLVDLPVDHGSRDFIIRYKLENGERVAARDDYSIRFSKNEMDRFESIQDLRDRIMSKSGVSSKKYWILFTSTTDPSDPIYSITYRVNNLRDIRRYDRVVTVKFEKLSDPIMDDEKKTGTMSDANAETGVPTIADVSGVSYTNKVGAATAGTIIISGTEKPQVDASLADMSFVSEVNDVTAVPIDPSGLEYHSTDA